jgi:hypothetical protein
MIVSSSSALSCYILILVVSLLFHIHQTLNLKQIWCTSVKSDVKCIRCGSTDADELKQWTGTIFVLSNSFGSLSFYIS